jgi:hypothetical protein
MPTTIVTTAQDRDRRRFKQPSRLGYQFMSFDGFLT